MECCIKINGVYADWFSLKLSLKQGCILSPSVFNLYINGLVIRMKRRGLVVQVDDLLLYADDLAILAESEQDLQEMQNVLHEWTQEFDMSVNTMHR